MGSEMCIRDSLDPSQIIEIRTLIKELGEEHTVILSTHILPEVTATCNRAVIISDGRVVAEESVSDLGEQESLEEKYMKSISGEFEDEGYEIEGL